MPEQQQHNRRHDDPRLDRIEQKIDKLSDAMISLARTEEKIISIEAHNRNIYDRLNRHSEKIDILEERVSDNTRTISIINKITWTAVTVLIGIIAQMLFK